MPIEDRVSNIISLMTLDEKIAFLSQTPGVERLGIKRMGHVEGLHGFFFRYSVKENPDR